MMSRISSEELKEILSSYGIDNLSYKKTVQVGPDMVLYVFSDKDDEKYVLVAADYLGDYMNIKLPYVFEFDDKDYKHISFRAVKALSYSENAAKRADGYIDDERLLTKASTGDVCLLFKCSDV